MRINIATLFPEMCEAVINTSIIGRAKNAGKVEIKTFNIRDYTLNKHRNVDDTPYGGGHGMVMQAQPIYDAFLSIPNYEKAHKINFSACSTFSLANLIHPKAILLIIVLLINIT